MSVFLFIVGVMLLVRVGSYLNMKDKEQQAKFKEEKKEKKCPAHSWSYNNENRLQCLDCNMKAGDISTNNGNY